MAKGEKSETTADMSAKELSTTVTWGQIGVGVVIGMVMVTAILVIIFLTKDNIKQACHMKPHDLNGCSASKQGTLEKEMDLVTQRQQKPASPTTSTESNSSRSSADDNASTPAAEREFDLAMLELTYEPYPLDKIHLIKPLPPIAGWPPRPNLPRNIPTTFPLHRNSRMIPFHGIPYAFTAFTGMVQNFVLSSGAVVTQMAIADTGSQYEILISTDCPPCYRAYGKYPSDEPYRVHGAEYHLGVGEMAYAGSFWKGLLMLQDGLLFTIEFATFDRVDPGRVQTTFPRCGLLPIQRLPGGTGRIEIIQEPSPSPLGPTVTVVKPSELLTTPSFTDQMLDALPPDAPHSLMLDLRQGTQSVTYGVWSDQGRTISFIPIEVLMRRFELQNILQSPLPLFMVRLRGIKFYPKQGLFDPVTQQGTFAPNPVVESLTLPAPPLATIDSGTATLACSPALKREILKLAKQTVGQESPGNLVFEFDNQVQLEAFVPSLAAFLSPHDILERPPLRGQVFVIGLVALLERVTFFDFRNFRVSL